MLAGLTHESAHSSQQQLAPAHEAAADGGEGARRSTTARAAGGSRRHARPVAVAELAHVLHALDNQQHHALRVTLAKALGIAAGAALYSRAKRRPRLRLHHSLSRHLPPPLLTSSLTRATALSTVQREPNGAPFLTSPL